MHLKRVLLLVLLATVTTVTLRCDNPEHQLPPGTVAGEVEVRLPAGCPAGHEDLVVYSGALDESDVDGTGKATVGLMPDAVNTVLAVANEDRPVLYAVLTTGGAGKRVVLDARSTAEALVFLHPYIGQHDLTIAGGILGFMGGLQEVSDLASLINTRLATSTYYLGQSDTALTSAILRAVKVVHAKLDSIEDTEPDSHSGADTPKRGPLVPGKSVLRQGDSSVVTVVDDVEAQGHIAAELDLDELTISPTEVSGVHVRADRTGVGQYRIWVKNTRRRDLGAYLMQSGSYDELAHVDVNSCAWVKYWPPSIGAPDSGFVDLSASTYRWTWIRAYGLGFHFMDEWNADPQKMRVASPAIYTFVYNFTIPVVSAFTGLPGIFGRGTQVGATLASQVKDATTISKVGAYLARKQVINALEAVGSRVLGVLKDNPQLLVDGAAELGITITKGSAEHILSFVPYLGFLKSCVDAANVGWTIGTVARSGIVVDFIIRYDGGGTNNPPDTPSTPSGPTSGQVGVSCTFSSTATDPDGDDVYIRFAWGDGDTSDWVPVAGGAAAGGESSSSPELGIQGFSAAQFLRGVRLPPGADGNADKALGMADNRVQAGLQGRVASLLADSARASHTWSSPGTFQVKAQAKDEEGAVSIWSSGHAVGVGGGEYPDSIVATISVGNSPYGIATLPDGSRIYVANAGSNNVSVIRTSDNSVVATVPVGNEPYGVAAHPNGSYVYVASAGSDNVSVIRTADNSVVASVPVGAGPHGVAALPTGSHVYVANYNSYPYSVSVIRTSDNSVVATVPVGAFPECAAALPGSDFVYVVNSIGNSISVIRTSDNSVVATVPVGCWPRDVAILPNGEYVYVSSSHSTAQNVSVIRTSDNTVVDTIAFGSCYFPWGVGALPSSDYVYVTSVGFNEVSVIRTSDNTVTGTIRVGEAPKEISVLPDCRYVYVVNTSSNCVSVIGFRGGGGTNNPPLTPMTPYGPASGTADSLYSFKTVTTDPDGDPVKYVLEWGDGSYDTSSFKASGETLSIGHIWSTGGTYIVKAKAFDIHGASSGWSPAHQIVITGGSNNPPYTPSTPTGPDSGYVDSVYSFRSNAIDPDSDSVALRFAWGDGDTSAWSPYVRSGQFFTMDHSWSDNGTYGVQAQARDVRLAASGWSDPIEVRIDSANTNQPPETPDVPLGPDSGYVDSTYEFTTSAVDPDSDSVSIRFAWGDGDTSAWSVCVRSGQPVTMDHSWSSAGTFQVKAQARDVYGALSGWSLSKSIVISESVPGMLRWRFLASDNIQVSSPAFATDGTVYIGSWSGDVYAVSPSGGQVWRYSTGGSVFSSPAVGADGTVYVGSADGCLYAILPSGTLKWRYDTGNEVWSSPAIAADGTVYFGGWGGNLYALNADSTLKWRRQINPGVFSSPAVALDGSIYVGSTDNSLYALRPDGTTRWRFRTQGAIWASPAIGADGTIYFGSNDNSVYAVYPDSTQRWTYQTGSDILSSPAVGPDGRVYVGSDDGYLYALEQDGSLYWQFPTGGGAQSSSSPAVGEDGTVYIGSSDHTLYAIRSDGTERWHFTTGGIVSSSPSIASDGTVYVGSYDDYLYAIRGDTPLAGSSWPKFHHDNKNTGRVGGGK